MMSVRAFTIPGMTPEEARALHPDAVETAAQSMHRQHHHQCRGHVPVPLRWDRIPEWEREDWRQDAAEIVASIAALGLTPKGTP